MWRLGASYKRKSARDQPSESAARPPIRRRRTTSPLAAFSSEGFRQGVAALGGGPCFQMGEFVSVWAAHQGGLGSRGGRLSRLAGGVPERLHGGLVCLSELERRRGLGVVSFLRGNPREWARERTLRPRPPVRPRY